ncbi:hypothetical protein CPLU01_08596 [Colletotrichum plurivorum]|uniref:Uncharacterized protein n=1 Tax=Colletotrichum plurivorum TaxID=2175906 RepID=A0A8H6KC61_9PEZI|nr:hypothetical protein CPLU01_08596 [Colletotrichum plurivorum]
MKPLSQIIAIIALVAPAAAQTPTGGSFTTGTLNPLPSLTINPVICPTETLTLDVCATCAVPQCITVSTLTRPCGCPTPGPTTFLEFPCRGTCGRIGCTTSYVFVSGEVPCDATASGPVTPTVVATVTTTETVASETETETTSATPTTITTTVSGEAATATTATPNAGGRLAVPFRFW